MGLKEKIKNKIKQFEEEKEELGDSDIWIDHKQKLIFVINIKLEVLREILGESEE
jgi:hypothetical protein|nr:MAG TPA: hypothetical protein [Caudoviricetes sp.]